MNENDRNFQIERAQRTKQALLKFIEDQSEGATIDQMREAVAKVCDDGTVVKNLIYRMLRNEEIIAQKIGNGQNLYSAVITNVRKPEKKQKKGPGQDHSKGVPRDDMLARAAQMRAYVAAWFKKNPGKHSTKEVGEALESLLLENGYKGAQAIDQILRSMADNELIYALREGNTTYYSDSQITAPKEEPAKPKKAKGATPNVSDIKVDVEQDTGRVMLTINGLAISIGGK